MNDLIIRSDSSIDLVQEREDTTPLASVKPDSSSFSIVQLIDSVILSALESDPNTALNNVNASALDRLIDEAINNPGKIVDDGTDTIAVSPQLAELIKSDPSKKTALFKDGEIVGVEQYQKAIEVLDRLDECADRLLETSSRYASYGELRASQRRQLDSSFRTQRRAYDNAAKEFEKLTGHKIDTRVADTNSSKQENANAIMEQHGKAKEALAGVFVIAQKNEIASVSKRGNFVGVSDPEVKLFLKQHPELHETFTQRSGSGSEVDRLRGLFIKDGGQTYNINRSSLRSNNGVVENIDGRIVPVSVEEQINRALNPEIRREHKEEILKDPLSKVQRDDTLHKMERVVGIYGSENERMQLSSMRQQESKEYAEAHRVALRNQEREHQERQQAIANEKAREVFEQNMQFAERCFKSGNFDNQILSSLRRNPAYRDALQDMAYHYTSGGRIERQVSAGIDEANHARQANTAAQSIRNTKEQEAWARNNLDPSIDLSNRIGQLEIERQTHLEGQRLAKTQGREDLSYSESQRLKQERQGIANISERVNENRLTIDPRAEKPITKEELPQAVKEEVERSIHAQTKDELSKIWSVTKKAADTGDIHKYDAAIANRFDQMSPEMLAETVKQIRAAQSSEFNSKGKNSEILPEMLRQAELAASRRLANRPEAESNPFGVGQPDNRPSPRRQEPERKITPRAPKSALAA